MAIKSLEELKKLRASLQGKIDLREKGEVSDDKTIEILIGMGTCGIAAGARETFNKLLEIINQKDLKLVKVISVGCIGFCHAEPTVQVNIPGNEPVIYGKITEDKALELIETVVIKGDFLEENFLVKSFEKAVV